MAHYADGGAGAIHPIYFGRDQTILSERRKTKQKTMKQRRLINQKQAA